MGLSFPNAFRDQRALRLPGRVCRSIPADKTRRRKRMIHRSHIVILLLATCLGGCDVQSIGGENIIGMGADRLGRLPQRLGLGGVIGLAQGARRIPRRHADGQHFGG